MKRIEVIKKQPPHLDHAQKHDCLPNQEGFVTDVNNLRDTVERNLESSVIDRVLDDLTSEIEIKESDV